MKGLARVLQVGVFIGGSLAASIPMPEEIKYWPNIVASVAYATVLTTIKPGSTGAKKWIVGSLVCGILAGILSFWISATYTVNIGGKFYIKGDLQPSVREDIKKRGITEADYFLWSGKKADEVWTSDSVATSTLIVATSYSLVSGLLAFGLLGMLEYLSKPAPILKWVLMILAIGIITIGAFLLGKYSHARDSVLPKQQAVPS